MISTKRGESLCIHVLQINNAKSTHTRIGKEKVFFSLIKLNAKKYAIALEVEMGLVLHLLKDMPVPVSNSQIHSARLYMILCI